MSSFRNAWQQFCGLPHVNVDSLSQQFVEDLVFDAVVQLDLIDEGEVQASVGEKAALQRFVKRWKN